MGARDALPEFFARVEALRGAPGVREDLFAFPGPFIRELVHFLDGVALDPGAIARFGAISAAVAGREGYFPPGADVFVAHPPTGLAGARRRARAGAGCSRPRGSTHPKRIDLLIRAMGLVRSKVELRIAGSGPRLRRAARAGRRRPADHVPRARRDGHAHRALRGRARGRVRAARGGLRARHARGDAGRQAGHHRQRLGRHRGARQRTARPGSSSSRRRRRWRRRSTSCGRTGARRSGWGAPGLERARQVTWDALVHELEAVV